MLHVVVSLQTDPCVFGVKTDFDRRELLWNGRGGLVRQTIGPTLRETGSHSSSTFVKEGGHPRELNIAPAGRKGSQRLKESFILRALLIPEM